jgi:hypothetical protein
VKAKRAVRTGRYDARNARRPASSKMLRALRAQPVMLGERVKKRAAVAA